MTIQLFIGERSAAALLAGLALLKEHATAGYQDPTILEVGAALSGLEPLEPSEIDELVTVLYEAAENTQPPSSPDRPTLVAQTPNSVHPTIDWDDPQARAALIERVGPAEFNRLSAAARKASVIMSVRGRDIIPQRTRFGTVFAIDGEGVAFSSLVDSVSHVLTLPGDPEKLDDLVTLYAAYVEREGLPHQSADELIFEDLTPAQRAWISAFIVRWEAVVHIDPSVRQTPFLEGE